MGKDATLSVVSTPIGNLGDITVRALEVLGTCDMVLCEDTRVTRKLLAHYNIIKPLLSYHAHSGTLKTEKVLGLLAEGKHLALVTDAGTPGISDPGARLIEAVRNGTDMVVRIEAIPGPSALATAVSIAGMPMDSFLFLGFPPHKKGRSTFFDRVATTADPVVFYESPHRFMKALHALASHEQSAHRTIAVCRELTKLHEQVRMGSAQEHIAYFEAHPEQVRGELVIIVGGAS